MGWLGALGCPRQITALSCGPNLIFVPSSLEVFPQHKGILLTHRGPESLLLSLTLVGFLQAVLPLANILLSLCFLEYAALPHIGTVGK